MNASVQTPKKVIKFYLSSFLLYIHLHYSILKPPLRLTASPSGTRILAVFELLFEQRTVQIKFNVYVTFKG